MGNIQSGGKRENRDNRESMKKKKREQEYGENV